MKITIAWQNSTFKFGDTYPGKWTKTHVINGEKTLCGVPIPDQKDVFDMSDTSPEGDCQICVRRLVNRSEYGENNVLAL